MPFISAAAATPSISSQSAITFANNFRIAAIGIAAYDYLITLPAEFRLYKSSSRRSLGFILFVLIRYLSVGIFIVSGVGFFYHHFPPTVCARYGYLSPVLKVLQVMVSHAILGVRTYNIAQRTPLVGRVILTAYFVVVVMEWVSELYRRFPVQTNGNCVIGTPHPDSVISAWTFYFFAMLFDLLTLSISTYHLLKAQANSISPASKLMRMLLYDGLIYFVALTAVNMVNIFLFRQLDHAIQASGVNLAYATTWIMSQRILIHVREARARQSTVIVSPPSTNMPSIVQMKLESCGDGSLTTNLTEKDTQNTPSEFDIEVRIDRSILRDTRLPHGERDFPALP